MEFSLNNIAVILNADCKGEKNVRFSAISVDSRTLSNPDRTLFAALVTSRNDGHKYIEKLYSGGVRAFLISSENINFKAFPGAGFILVHDTLKSLQHLAAYKRSIFKVNVIGITGSNGKTIVKEWLAQLMSVEENICRSPKSFNSQIGVPLSVWGLNEKNTLGIFEAGISEPDEMENLEKIIRPTYGIFTNIKAAHDENFVSRQQKADEKIKLFLGCRKIFFCADHKEIVKAISHNGLSQKRLVSWGKSGKKNKNLNTLLRITGIKGNGLGSTINAIYRNKKIQVAIPFNDRASIENAIHCWLYLLESKFPNRIIQERMLQLSPLAMRMELKKGINGCSIINDSYSSDVESLSIALDFLNRQVQHSKKTVILSDILESGKHQKELYSTIARLLQEKKIDRLIGIGEQISQHKRMFGCEKQFYNSTEQFVRAYSPAMFRNEAILLKGARKFGFEKISIQLQEKSHDTVLEINLNHLVHNLNYYRSLLRKEVKVMAMVKAFSYGSGSYEIASALQHHGVNYLAVAYSDEGVELRKAGIKLPIMVMNPEEQSFNDLIEYNLEPEIFSHHILDRFFVFLQEYDFKKFPGIHIKIDTGMHRLGFQEKEIPDLLKKLKLKSKIKVLSIFSHLAGSDSSLLDAFTQTQINIFKNQSEFLSAGLGYKPLFHICNSAAITRFPGAHFDMVRLGIGLYGIGIGAAEKKKLINAGVWKTKISQIKYLSPGDTVGYNRSATVHKPTVIAIVPVGYADGFSRRLSNGRGYMYLRGRKVPVIGNVCMDMCMLDVTDVVISENIREGEDVVIFDSSDSLKRLSQKSETIPYEILTSVSQRVKRIYVEE